MLKKTAFVTVAAALLFGAADLLGQAEGGLSEEDLRQRVTRAFLGQRHAYILDPMTREYVHDDPLPSRLPPGVDHGLLVMAVLRNPPYGGRSGAKLQNRCMSWLRAKRDFRAKPLILELAASLEERPDIDVDLASALGSLCGDEGFEILRKLVDSKSTSTRFAVAGGLCPCGERALPLLRRLAEHDSDRDGRLLARGSIKFLEDRQKQTGGSPGRPEAPPAAKTEPSPGPVEESSTKPGAAASTRAPGEQAEAPPRHATEPPPESSQGLRLTSFLLSTLAIGCMSIWVFVRRRRGRSRGRA